MWKKSENYLDKRFLTLYYDEVTMKYEIEKFRDGMFEAPSRTYGETYMEPIIRNFYGYPNHLQVKMMRKMIIVRLKK